MQTTKVDLKIDNKLLEKLRAYLPESGLTSEEELILSILQNFIDENYTKEENETLDEEREIEKRLKNLGYL